MAGESACRARDAEIETLLKPFGSGSGRSATLLFGDSGIGKSTLLREMERRLSAQDGFTAGLYECAVGDSDPLLRALDRLLRQIYTVAGTLDQIEIACQNLKNQLSISGLKDFLLAGLRTTGEVAGLGPLAKIATQSFGWLADKATALDASVPSGFLPKLGIGVFRDILKILQTALPGRKLVFLLDNLSAPFESLTAEGRGSSAIDTLQTFISQDYGQARCIHFLLSWKLTPKTQKVFDELETALQEYGGRVIQLGPMTKEGVAAWMTDDFSWFAGLDEAERQRVVNMSGGLPQIVAGWRESGMQSGQVEELQDVADSVRAGKYRYLARMLEQAPVRERELILAVCLVEHPLSAAELAELLRRPPGAEEEQACFDSLRAWAGKHLLRQHVGSPVRFSPEHEKKREVALDSLNGTMADGGRSVHERAHDFLLDRIELFSPLDSAFNDAMELAWRSPLLAGRQADMARMRAVAEAIRTGRLPADADSDQWELPAGWPRRLQALFLEMSLTYNYGDPVRVGERLWAWVAESPSPPQDVRRARALADAQNMLAVESRKRLWLPILGGILNRLRRLHGAFVGDRWIAESLADTATVAAGAACQLKQIENAKSVIKLVRELENKFPESYVIAKALAEGAEDMAPLLIELGRTDEAEELLPDLRHLAARFPKPPSAQNWEQFPMRLRLVVGGAATIPQKLAKILALAVEAHAGRREMERCEELMAELRLLQGLFPGDLFIALCYALTLNAALTAYEALGGEEAVEAALNQVRDLSAAFAWSQELRSGVFQLGESEGEKQAPRAPFAVNREALTEIARAVGPVVREQERQLLKTLLSMTGRAAMLSRNIGSMPGFLARVSGLRALREVLPGQKTVTKLLAIALVNAMQSSFDCQDQEQTEKLFEELAKLEDEEDGDGLIAETIAKGISLVITAYRADQPLEKLNSWVVHARKMAETWSGPAISWAAKALANATRVYCTVQRVSEIQPIVELLRELRSRDRADSGIAESLAVAIGNLADCYRKLGQCDGIEPALQELRELAAEVPGNAALLQSLAYGLKTGIMAYAQTQRITEVERLMLELFDLCLRTEEQQTLRNDWREAFTFYNYWRGARVPQSPVLAEELAKGFALTFNQFTDGNAPQLERLDKCVEEVRQLHRAHPASEMVGRCLAGILHHCAWLFRSAQRMERLEPLLEELRQLHVSFPDTASITEILGKSLYSAIVDYGQKGSTEQQKAVTAELLRILATAPELAAQPPFDRFPRIAPATGV